MHCDLIYKNEKKNLHKAAEHDFLALKISNFLFFLFFLFHKKFYEKSSFLEIRLIDKLNTHTFMQRHPSPPPKL